jgi:high-affinity nickel-transport protein
MLRAGLASREPSQLLGLGAVIVALHAAGWGGVWVFGAQYPALIGLAGVAYVFGLRHAFDADHIAAIDNTTRRLMHEPGARPLGVGLFFSLGHSTVVLLMTIAVAFATEIVTAKLPHLKDVGQVFGASVSGTFLLVIGLINLVVFVDLARAFRQVRTGGDPALLEARLRGRGAVGLWFRWLFQLVHRPWHMYLVGFLFGLGFDTATEIGLLTAAAVAASNAMPLAAVLTLPIVFAAGMSLMDSADGVLMCGAYGWAFKNPQRKMFYNLAVTALSVAIALAIGARQLATIAVDDAGLTRAGFMQPLLGWDLQYVGVGVVAMFVVLWGGSVLGKVPHPHGRGRENPRGGTPLGAA